MADARASAKDESTTTEAEAQAPGLLDQIVAEGRFGKTRDAQVRGKDLVGQFVEEILKGTVKVGHNTEAMINARIAQIDALLSKQLNEILHHPKYQELEASWRGLKYLVNQSETGEQLKLKVFNVTKKELLKDLTQASDFDQSALFKKVYSEEYGVFGGAPFGALLGNYAFDKVSEDIDLLEGLSSVAAAAHAPFIASASHEMFNLESFAQLDQPRDLAKVLDSVEYAKWKAFRDTEDSRYVALAMPRMMLREPYGAKTVPVEAFNYEENMNGLQHEDYLWGSAAWALGARVTDAFAKYGWCAAIRGVESGGLVTGLPVHTFKTEAGETVMKCPTEVAITDSRDKELSDLGFVGLCHQKDTPNAAFFAVQSTQKPKVYDQPDATANARISAQLPYIFATSRFAHYLKVMMRDKIGGFMNAATATAFLNTWIMQYVVSNDDASFETKAKRPLKEARIDVVEVPGKPGVLRAVAFMRPHFQLDELSISMRLVADLPQPKA